LRKRKGGLTPQLIGYLGRGDFFAGTSGGAPLREQASRRFVSDRNAHFPRVAIALGGGGARGVAHVLALEALDELGIRPVAIAGTSMGAVVGAAYAAGIDAREIRIHILKVLRNRSDVMAKLLRARVGRFTDLVLRGRGNPILLDPEICLDLFWPEGVPARFEQLALRTIIVATDYAGRKEAAYSEGPLRPAVAGSMAIPGLFRPVAFGDAVLIDGGACNPLPYDLLFDLADIVVAVDVTFGGRGPQRQSPSPFASMFGAAQIMQGAITAQKIKLRAPDILVRPKVEQFGVLDFFRASQILRGAESAKEELKIALGKRLTMAGAA
jgi:NTE family protein